jgi:hypothetical protein
MSLMGVSPRHSIKVGLQTFCADLMPGPGCSCTGHAAPGLTPKCTPKLSSPRKLSSSPNSLIQINIIISRTWHSEHTQLDKIEIGKQEKGGQKPPFSYAQSSPAVSTFRPFADRF